MIREARADVARAVDSGLMTLYWRLGRRIRQDFLKTQRAEHGEKIVQAVPGQLTMEVGRRLQPEKSVSDGALCRRVPDQDYGTASTEICPVSLVLARGRIMISTS